MESDGAGDRTVTMKNKKYFLAFLLAFILIIALYFLHFCIKKTNGFWICEKGSWVKQGNPNYPKPIKSCGQSKPLGRTKDDCLKQGGVWKKQGPEPFETCNRKAQDRGNLCRDNSECEGTCQVELTQNELSQGMRGKIASTKKYGQCSVWVIELGCFGFMKNGQTQVICID